MPTRNSWPTRWARVIRAKTRAGQEAGCRCRAGPGFGVFGAAELGTPPPAAGPGPVAADEAEGPEARPHPEHVRASATKQPMTPPTVLRVTIPLRFQIVTLPTR